MKPRTIALAAVLALGTAAFAQTYVAKEYSFSGPETLRPGYVELKLQNAGKQPFMMQVVRLKDGAERPQLMDALKKLEAAKFGLEGWKAVYRVADAHGAVGMTPPSQTGKAGLVLGPGRYALFAPNTNEKGQSLAGLGMVKLVEVKGQPVAAPKADLKIPMYDFAFALPGALKAGKQRWEVVNNGKEPHELVMLRVLPGKTAQQAIAFMHAERPEGEPPVDFGSMVATGLVSEGQRMFVDVNLQKGTYVITCFLPALEGGKPHHDLGMEMSFEVR